MTNWVNIIAALLPCISREDPRHVILLKSLAHQAQHALTANADRAVLSMRTLDSTLLKTLPASEEVPSLLALETKLDAWLESYIRSTTYSSDDGQSSTNGVPSPVRLSSQGEAFQAACQLRARLAISLAGIPPPPAIGLHGEGLLSTHNDRESKEEHMGVDFSICSTILRNVLDIANLSTAPLQGASSIETGPGSKGKSDFSFFLGNLFWVRFLQRHLRFIRLLRCALWRIIIGKFNDCCIIPIFTLCLMLLVFMLCLI